MNVKYHCNSFEITWVAGLSDIEHSLHKGTESVNTGMPASSWVRSCQSHCFNTTTIKRNSPYHSYYLVLSTCRYKIIFTTKLIIKMYSIMAIQEMKATRVMWLGHLLRTDELYPCRKVAFTNPDDARKVGRPPARRVDSVEEDLKRNGVNCKTKAADRMDWRSVVGAVEVGTRL
jgi:hypothetical protein